MILNLGLYNLLSQDIRGNCNRQLRNRFRILIRRAFNVHIPLIIGKLVGKSIRLIGLLIGVSPISPKGYKSRIIIQILSMLNHNKSHGDVI